MRAPPAVLQRRLETSPTTNLVCEINGTVVAVLYMQLVLKVETVDEESFMQISDAHSPTGSIIQLVAIQTDPEVRNLGIGSELRAFALHLARIDSSVESVIGVTRCRNFKDFNGTMQAYVDKHVAGELHDPVIGFHTSFGAQVVKLVHNFRPEDTDNNGIGVLIQYQVKHMATVPVSTSGALSLAVQKEEDVLVPSVDMICGLMEELGYPADRANLSMGFFDYGMDSLELVRIRNKLSGSLAMELPATLLLDFPTVQELAEQLDKDRGVGKTNEQQGPHGHAEEQTLSWDSLGIKDLLELQDRAKKLFALPQYQLKFTNLSKKCYPDMCKYILAAEEIMVEVEGSIFHDYGLIEDIQWATVQKGRGHWTDCLMKYWAEVPELRTRSHEIMHLTKQDQVWC